MQYKTLSVKLLPEQHTAFHKFCKSKGTTANAYLKDVVTKGGSPTTIQSKNAVIFSSIAVGIPVGIYAYGKIKERIAERHLNYSQKKVNNLSIMYGTGVGIVTTFVLMAAINAIL